MHYRVERFYNFFNKLSLGQAFSISSKNYSDVQSKTRDSHCMWFHVFKYYPKKNNCLKLYIENNLKFGVP